MAAVSTCTGTMLKVVQLPLPTTQACTVPAAAAFIGLTVSVPVATPLLFESDTACEVICTPLLVVCHSTPAPAAGSLFCSTSADGDHVVMPPIATYRFGVSA